MIAILDYDAGNVRSVEKAVVHLGYDAIVTREPKEIAKADHVILPGVGAFRDAMEHLNKYQLVAVIHELVEKEIPFLGICLGLQVLFQSSEEAPGVRGLSLLDGHVFRFPSDRTRSEPPRRRRCTAGRLPESSSGSYPHPRTYFRPASHPEWQRCCGRPPE